MPRIIHFEIPADDTQRAVPGVGYMAYCRDTEGNLFGIMQNDKNAK
jgi:uncharacterized protein